MVADDEAFAQTQVYTEDLTGGPGATESESDEDDAIVAPGQNVGRFVLMEKLGEGGMGVVFIARDPELQRDVALKVLRRSAAGTEGTHAQQRMLREAQAMAMLTHPNMVAIYEVGTFEEHVFIAMEYVVGKTLDDWLEEGHHLEDIIGVFEQAGYALQAIHDAGLVHRDFKPANVLVTADGTAKVLDLGIARKVGDEVREEKSGGQDRGSVPASDPEGSVESKRNTSSPPSGQDAFADALTQEGALVGTPTYMSPEQLLGQEVGPATDQFAFAIALFEALAGYRPFAGKNHVQVMANIVGGSLRPFPEDSEVPQGLRDALRKALQREESHRYSTMSQLLGALREGLGLRGQIRFLTSRWKEGDLDKQYLLSEGNLLQEGVTLLHNQPAALNDAQQDFIRASARAVRRRVMSRRAITWGLGAVTLGLVPTVVLLERRGRQLEEATRAELQASINAVREAVSPVLRGAHEELMMMFAQRAAWVPMLDQLLSVEPEGVENQQALLAAVARMNDYFRPVVERIGIISSLMVASDDEMEYLVFRDPDAAELDPPYHLYNRYVRRAHYGDDAFEVFWPESVEHAPRARWLSEGEPDSRGRKWSGYHPSKRVWFEKAVEKSDGHVAWTNPYLFFVTKDAGVTGAIAWTRGGRRFVLAVDFMLTDLSLITTDLDSPSLLASIVSQDGETIALPKDPRFSDASSIRAFFVERNKPPKRSVSLDSEVALDTSADLPSVAEVGPPELVAAVRPYSSRREVYNFEFRGEQMWAGRAPVGDPALGLTVYVVQRAD